MDGHGQDATAASWLARQPVALGPAQHVLLWAPFAPHPGPKGATAPDLPPPRTAASPARAHPQRPHPGPSGSHSGELCGCAKELPNSSFPLRSVIDFYPWLCFLRAQLPAVNHGSKILNVNFQM